MLRDLNKSSERQAKHPFRIGIPRKSHANPARNADEEGVRKIIEVRVEEAEAVLAYAIATPTTSPKDLDYLQKTKPCNGATIRSLTVLVANRTYDKRTREAHYGRGRCLYSRRKAPPSRANR
jgi:hypothetical protein